MILYDSPVSGNCYKVRLLLAHLGIPYERRYVDAVDRTNTRDELEGLNPTRRVPTLVLDDGRALGESGAILLHLGDGSEYVPGDAYERAQMLQWLFFEQAEHMQAFAVVRFLRTFSGRASELGDRIDGLTKAAHRSLRTMEGHLQGKSFFVADRLTLADIALYAYTHREDETGVALDPYPEVCGWLERVEAQRGHVPMDA